MPRYRRGGNFFLAVCANPGVAIAQIAISEIVVFSMLSSKQLASQK
jgi:hypothetical protein